MTADEAYRWLMGNEQRFEAHVFASILALSLSEALAQHRLVHETAGYEGWPPDLAALFPHAASVLAKGDRIRRSDDEACLLDLLSRGSSSGAPLELLLAGMIARRAQRPNHLWQDLGLRNRGELSQVMTTWFVPLARRNIADMKWKKFFFRQICRDASYTLCTAPSCGECCDYDACFNEESGESLLAHLRRSAEGAG